VIFNAVQRLFVACHYKRVLYYITVHITLRYITVHYKHAGQVEQCRTRSTRPPLAVHSQRAVNILSINILFSVY